MISLGRRQLRVGALFRTFPLRDFLRYVSSVRSSRGTPNVPAKLLEIDAEHRANSVRDKERMVNS